MMIIGLVSEFKAIFDALALSKTNISTQDIYRFNSHSVNLGIASGVSLSRIFQQYTDVLAILTALVAWSGSGIGIYKLFSEYFKEQNKPKLDYSEVYPSGSNCFLKISMVSGEGMAEGCIGTYTIKNKMDDVPSVWEHSERRECDIGPPMGLLLFGIEGDKIVFSSAHGYQPYGSKRILNP
jgi:hypothetical protein